MTEPRPYPVDLWPKMGRREAALLNRCARMLPVHSLARLQEELGALTDVQAQLTYSVLEHCPAETMEQALDELVVAAILGSRDGSPRKCIAIEITPRLAVCLVDRVLGGVGGAVVAAPVGALSDVERGVLAYLAGRLLGTVEGLPWRLATIITSKFAMMAALGDGGALVWPAVLRLGEDEGVVRAWIPDSALAPLDRVQAAVPEISARASTLLDGIALTLTASVGRGAVQTEELLGIRPSDVLILDEAWARPAAGGLEGHAHTTIVGAGRTRWISAVHHGQLAIEEVRRSLSPPRRQGIVMSENDTQTKPSALHMAGDAPVEVSAEIARFVLPLEELAALSCGQVLGAGQPVDRRVTLRAGDKAIAVGELVDLDGEVGVRVLELIA